jgi:hypothetical protein
MLLLPLATLQGIRYRVSMEAFWMGQMQEH